MRVTHHSLMNHFAELKRCHAESGYIPPSKQTAPEVNRVAGVLAEDLARRLFEMVPVVELERDRQECLRKERIKKAKERARRNRFWTA